MSTPGYIQGESSPYDPSYVPSDVAGTVAQNIATVTDAFNSALAAAQSSGNALNDYLTDSTASASTAGAIQNEISVGVEPWANRGNQLATLGTAATQQDLDTWISQGNELLSTARAEYGYAGEANLVNIVANTAAQTAADVGHDAAAVAGGAFDLAVWLSNNKTLVTVVVGVLALAYLAHKVG